MNVTYQQCSEGLLTFLSQGQEHEKSNSKEVQRSDTQDGAGRTLSATILPTYSICLEPKDVSEYEVGWGHTYLNICKKVSEIQLITPRVQDVTQGYCQAMAEVLITPTKPGWNTVNASATTRSH